MVSLLSETRACGFRSRFQSSPCVCRAAGGAALLFVSRNADEGVHFAGKDSIFRSFLVRGWFWSGILKSDRGGREREREKSGRWLGN